VNVSYLEILLLRRLRSSSFYFLGVLIGIVRDHYVLHQRI